MRILVLLVIGLLGICPAALGQCEIALDEVDEIDSLRTVMTEAVKFGYLIPSKYETVDGPKFIEQGKASLSYTENDTIGLFFLILAVPEYSFEPIESGFNVFLKLSDGEVIQLYNVPDRGEFDRSTNMRLYQHACVLPIDIYYRLTLSTIEKIRINFENQKRTLTLSSAQQAAIRESVQCLGRTVGVYPVKP